MITASENLINLLKTQTNLNISVGATLEHNLNLMVNKIKATSNGADHVLSGAFKKLFPIDTIYKPFRPLSPGIKYLIYTVGNTDNPKDSFVPPKSIDIGTVGNTGRPTPRLYYPGSTTYYKYWLGPKNSNIDVSLEYFDDNIENPIVVKQIPTNKIVARFEVNHDIPSNWSITITKIDGSTVTKSGTSLNVNGEAIIYYNGTEWSTVSPEKYTSTEYIKKVSISATNSGSGKFLALLELSPRWVQDISSDIQDFDITKETGADNNSLLPVGLITANTLNIRMNKFRQGYVDILEYDKNIPIDSSKTYFYKNSVITPYINFINQNDVYEIKQGTFYMHSWSIGEFGNGELLCLDACKILQETLCPEILVQDAPVTAIIRRLLDSVGFTNYKINLKKVNGIVEDDIATVKYWWTEKDRTVFEALQELCRDIQMNAFVDENNILNFYSRNYIYDSERESSWDFSSENIIDNSTTYLPNIMNLFLKQSPTVNEVKILWSAPQTTQYDGGSSPLWKSEENWLGAGTLISKLNDSDPSTPNDYFNLNDNTLSAAQNIQSLFNYQGYVLINGEVIEYDGVEYQYVPKNSPTNTYVPVIIKSTSDIYKYRALSKAGYSNINDVNSAYFKPTGRYKIKTRGALNTKRLSHEASPDSFINKSGESNPSKFNMYSINIATDAEAKEKAATGSFKTPTSPASRIVTKSFLSMSNLDKDKRTFNVATRAFDSVNTSSNYFTFGTRVYFDSQFESPEQVGGVCFFSTPNGDQAYYIVIHTTASAKMKKDIRIIKKQKVGNKTKTFLLKDTQTTALNTLAGIYAGKAYNVDVIVKKDAAKNRNIITAFINGMKIEAVDNLVELADTEYPPISPTKNIGLLCGQGIVYFEYVYAKDITEQTYIDTRLSSSYSYNGVYSDDSLSMLYGDFKYFTGETQQSSGGALLEFGVTAREIKYAKVKYDSYPAIPIKFSTSKNRYVTLLESRIQPFSAETFVLNNTSTYVPLDDGNYSSFYVLGNSIYKSSPIEYSTYLEDDKIENKEFGIFQTNWIQTESDAKALAEWMKSTVLNKNKYVEMEVFGNPLIGPGDVITINYPLQGLDGNNKYMITRSTLSYSEGITTIISCKAI